MGLRFCPTGLIDQLASQTAGLANGLPLLQFALRRLWDTRPRNAQGEPLDLITEEQVNALPDVQRALGTVADGIFQQFTPAQRRICERMLQELVVLDENFEEPLRRRRNEAELTAVLHTRLPAAAEDVATVIEQFAKAGLLRRFGDGSQRQIEVAHEALLRHWEHINRLVTGERVKEQLHLVKQVGREAAEWVSRGKPEGYLNLRGERLERALEYAKDGWLAEIETTEYVEACDAREKAEKVKEAQAQEAKAACAGGGKGRGTGGTGKGAGRKARGGGQGARGDTPGKEKNRPIVARGCIRVAGGGWSARVEYDYRPAPGSREPARPGEAISIRSAPLASACRRGKDWTWPIRLHSKGIRAFAFPSLMHWSAWTIPGWSANTAMSVCLPTRMAAHCCRSTAHPAVKACESIRLSRQDAGQHPSCPSPCRTASTRSNSLKSDRRLVARATIAWPCWCFAIRPARITSSRPTTCGSTGRRVSNPIPPP